MARHIVAVCKAVLEAITTETSSILHNVCSCMPNGTYQISVTRNLTLQIKSFILTARNPLSFTGKQESLPWSDLGQ